MRWLWLLLIPLPVALSGCTCMGEAIDMDVTLSLDREEVRSLPILASGAMSVTGLDIPDSHGKFTWDVDFDDHRVSQVDVHGLWLEIEVAGRTVPVDITHVEGLAGGGSGQDLHGRLTDGKPLQLWWAVDRNQIDIPAGTSYEATLRFSWSIAGCTYQASGDTTARHADQIQDSLVTTTFAAVDSAVSKTGATVSFSADLRVKSGVHTELDEARAVAIWHGPVPAATVWTSTTMQVNNLPLRDAGPGDEVRITGPARATTADSGGTWLLVVWVDHDVEGASGVEKDLLAFVH
ncbi:MAG: hypothetical protein ACPHID_07605 [Thermoplasmatota archaeon]